MADNGVTLSWDAPVSTVNGYKVLRRRVYLDETDFTSVFSLYSDMPANIPTSYTDFIAKVAGEYRYKVESLDSNGDTLGTTSEVTVTVEPAAQGQQVAVTAANTLTPTITSTPSVTPTATNTGTAVPNLWPRNVPS